MAVAVGCYMWLMGSLMGAQAAYKSMMCWWLLLGRPRTSALKIMGFMMLLWPAQPPAKKMEPVIKLQAPCHQTTSPVMSDAISDLEDQVYQRWQGIENHTPCQLCCYQFLLNWYSDMDRAKVVVQRCTHYEYSIEQSSNLKWSANLQSSLWYW